ncbi:hypothetical protein IT072_03090 [Leifsonia sp. ZF2019]|uniref:hypothetical protein n=1 Tax=Leifsonia sp. ZF2019 TaxID=2781978 RepID=UPI001CC049A4|nr:hypothetical protein [Leifsonia sp. ZF2019]UAJ80067.1 hypothetical protein IT072_03090 [Leifsonia sp. ZF2019]
MTAFITPLAGVVGVVFVAVMLALRIGRKRLWWIPLPAIGLTLAAFIAATLITANLLP